MNFEKEILQKKIQICDKHLTRLLSAMKAIKPLLPLTVEKYRGLSYTELSFIDQISYRFGKLQDDAGRLLRFIIVKILREDLEQSPFIDILNSAEKLRLIENAVEWIRLREFRSILTHEYNENDIVDGINKLYEISEGFQRCTRA
ncbi:MAG: hypothetical protein N2257_10265 [Thermodesulfovibrionales bacterium]|nr:hypothetical protein [Thermodesulfovibrionales bacterium]